MSMQLQCAYVLMDSTIDQALWYQEFSWCQFLWNFCHGVPVKCEYSLLL